MLETLKTFDESLFLILNAYHTPYLDPLMWLFSEKLFWGPLYVWFLWLLYKKYQKYYWTVLVVVAVMIISSDQLCNFSKENVMRLRPSQEPHLQTLVHIVKGYRGGQYGFYSGHASNAFAVALFMLTAMAGDRKYLIPVVFAYAILTSYSRIYLGVHYPGDILVGSITGSFLGTGFALLHHRLRNRFLKSVKLNDGVS